MDLASPRLQFEQVLKRAIEKKASDVHLKVGLPPVVRVHGNLYYLGQDSGENIARMTAEQLWEMARALMTVRQTERYQNGEEVDLGYEVPNGGRFRINLCQNKGNPRFVCRHIPEAIKSLEELALPKSISDFASLHRGLVLVTGATGSGKSTTLAGIIDLIARTRSCHIVTIEDPIEFSFKDRKSVITQREVGLDTRSFSHALKYSLRQDPDVILVGEMRDEETILMAMSAAETGHLVFSTLHTNDASETINRILGSVSAALQPHARMQMAGVLAGVVSQRLIRRADGKGRVAATEIMIVNQRIRDMISDPERTAEIPRAIEESQSMGMQTFDQCLMRMLQSGVINKEEALMNCSHLQDFQLRLEGVVSGEFKEAEEPSASRSDLVAKALSEDSSEKNIQLEIPKKGY